MFAVMNIAGNKSGFAAGVAARALPLPLPTLPLTSGSACCGREDKEVI